MKKKMTLLLGVMVFTLAAGGPAAVSGVAQAAQDQAVSAQEESGDTGEGAQASARQQVVVTAKSNQAIEDTAGVVTVITAEDISRSNATTIKDILIENAGINPGVNSASTYGRQTVSIWGSSSDHVLILVDGKKVSGSDAQIGHSDFQYNWVPLDSVERIEVIKGPMSSVYGSQAIGGVINIITRQSDKKFWGDIDLKYGSSSDDGGDIGTMAMTVGGRVSSKLRLMAGAEKTDLDPARDDDDSTATKIEGREVNNGLAKLWLDLDPTQSITASYSQGTENRLLADDSIYYDIDRKEYSAGYKKTFGSVNLSVDGYVTDADYHYLGSSSPYVHSMTDSVGKAELSIASFDHNYIVTGLEYKKEEYEKDYDNASKSGSNFNDDVDNTSAFLQDEIEVGEHLLLTLGSRYDHHEKFGGEFSPKANALYKIGEHHRIKIGYGEGFKAPTVTQNSSEYASVGSGHTFYGNDDLEPEKSKSYQVGYEFYTDGLTFKATLFKTDITNLISYTLIDTGVYEYVNVNEAETRGLELETTFDINDANQIRIGYQYLSTEDKSTGGELAYRPAHTLKARLTSRLPYDLNLTLSANYIGEQSDSGVEYDAFTIYKAQLSKEVVKGLTVRVGVDNISDEDLDDKPYDIPGRLAYVGLKYKF